MKTAARTDSGAAVADAVVLGHGDLDRSGAGQDPVAGTGVASVAAPLPPFPMQRGPVGGTGNGKEPSISALQMDNKGGGILSGSTGMAASAPMAGDGETRLDLSRRQDMLFEPASTAEWRQLIGEPQWTGADGGDNPMSPWAPAPAQTGSQQPMLARDAAQLARVATGIDGGNGQFTIEMQGLGVIDGRLHIQGERVDICLCPRAAATRVALLKKHGALQREASQQAGFEINLAIE
jgi:hypothetical protein